MRCRPRRAAVAGRQEPGSGHRRGTLLLLETIREFATELLDRSGEIESVGSRHADYYGGVAEQGEPGLQSAEDRQWLARFDAERDNFRTAFAFARDHDLPARAAAVAALRPVGALGCRLASFGGGSMRRSSMPETRCRSSVRMRSRSRRWTRIGPATTAGPSDTHSRCSKSRVSSATTRARGERSDETRCSRKRDGRRRALGR